MKLSVVSGSASADCRAEDSTSNAELLTSPRPSSLKERRRLSSEATSLIDFPDEDDDDEGETDPTQPFVSDDHKTGNDPGSPPTPRAEFSQPYQNDDAITQARDENETSIDRITEGVSNLLCPSLVACKQAPCHTRNSSEADSVMIFTASPSYRPRSSSEAESVENYTASTVCAPTTLFCSKKEGLQSQQSQTSLTAAGEIPITSAACADLDLEELRQQLEIDFSVLLGSTTGAADEWLTSLRAWLVPSSDLSRKTASSSRRIIRNRCGLRAEQAQRLQYLWNSWHSDTEEAVRALPRDNITEAQKTQNVNMPPLPLWSLAVTKSLDDADWATLAPTANNVGASHHHSWKQSAIRTNLGSLDSDLYYDSDPEIFRQATSSPKVSTSEPLQHATHKPIRHRRQIDLPNPIQTVVSVGSGVIECPPTPRNSSQKGAPSFDERETTGQFDVRNEEVVQDFLKELTFGKTPLLWHPYPKATTSDKSASPKSRSPVSVQAWFEMGSRLPTTMVQPKFMWQETYQPDLLNHKTLRMSCRKPEEVPLLSMIRILKPTTLDRLAFPFAKLDRSFTIQTHSDQLFVFEASSVSERDRIVHGLKLVVARLASMIIVGDDLMFVEFFSPFGSSFFEGGTSGTPVDDSEVHEEYVQEESSDTEESCIPKTLIISTTDKDRENLWGMSGAKDEL